MGWVLAVGALWLVLATVAALLIGRGIRIADQKAAEAAAEAGAPNFVVEAAPSSLPDVEDPAEFEGLPVREASAVSIPTARTEVEPGYRPTALRRDAV